MKTVKVKMNMKQLAKVKDSERKLKRYLQKHGINTDMRVELETPEGKRYIVFVQRLSEEVNDEV